MGMAASQARYLALVARQSNCEYEGQQINQARTALSNQSANLFNQMLGLNVPVPPSTQDYTKIQYSYSDGLNSSVIDSWQQLANPEPDYNYVVKHHYYADVYTGSQKKLNDPQVQFSGDIPSNPSEYRNQIDAIAAALRAIQTAQADYDKKNDEYLTLCEKAKNLKTYADNSAYTNVTECTYNAEAGTYTVKNSETDSTFTSYEKLEETNKTAVDKAIQELIDNGAIPEDYDKNNIYFNSTDGTIAFQSDLAQLKSSSTGGTKTTLPVYHISGTAPEGQSWYSIDGISTDIAAAKAAADTAKNTLETAQTAYENLSVPDYVGNCPLTPLLDLSEDQKAEINQIVKDMQKQGIDSSIAKCFDSEGNYINGSIFSFVLNGITYYTTYSDLADCARSGHGINNIDDQSKLTYYNASYVSTKIEETNKALLETDGNGRFVSVRFDNDSITYTLNAETITDEAAYQDAMNQYYYETAVYDKTVQDINAKTSIIQQEDLQLELRLKQLDTEREALSTEIDAVSKVVKDNIDKSFKTFGG